MRNIYRVGGTIYRVGGLGGIGRVIPQVIESPYDGVRFFASHDIVIDAGIGRSGFLNFGGAWVADTMGFGVALPWVIGTNDFVLDYSWMDLGGGFGRNKHGLSWWEEEVTGGGGLDNPTGGFVGCWDPAVGGGYAFFLGSTLQTKASVLAPDSPTNVVTWRRISRKGEVWRILDGPERPADGSLGEATWTAPDVAVSAFPGIRMAGTHRVILMQWQLA